MAILAGNEACLSSPRHCRMGLIWVKLWKQTEVAGKAAKFAAAQRVGRNFVVAQ